MSEVEKEVAAVVKKEISAIEFEKKIEIESAHLQYMDRLDKEEADRVALAGVSAAYKIMQPKL